MANSILQLILPNHKLWLGNKKDRSYCHKKSNGNVEYKNNGWYISFVGIFYYCQKNVWIELIYIIIPVALKVHF